MDNPKINSLNSNSVNRRPVSQQNQAMQQQRASENRSTSAASARGPARTDFGVAHSPGRLTEGDIIRGEVSDLFNNDITITLENNTISKSKNRRKPNDFHRTDCRIQAGFCVWRQYIS